MWWGKLAIITYVFCGVLLFVGFIIFETLSFSIFDEGTLTEASMEQLVGAHNTNISPNTNFIFGDAIATIQAIGGILFQSVTGGIVGDTISSIPFFNADFTYILLFRFLYTFSQAMLIIAWLANREA
jgi:hypothetical protein